MGEAAEQEIGGAKQTFKELFAGAAGGVAQVLIGELLLIRCLVFGWFFYAMSFLWFYGVHKVCGVVGCGVSEVMIVGGGILRGRVFCWRLWLKTGRSFDPLEDAVGSLFWGECDGDLVIAGDRNEGAQLLFYSMTRPSKPDQSHPCGPSNT